MKEYSIVAKLISTEPTKEWHKGFMGRKGHVAFNAVAEPDGKRTLFFESFAWSEKHQDYDEFRFETTPGVASLDGDKLSFVSQNTVYIFKTSRVGSKAFPKEWSHQWRLVISENDVPQATK